MRGETKFSPCQLQAIRKGVLWIVRSKKLIAQSVLGLDTAITVVAMAKGIESTKVLNICGRGRVITVRGAGNVRPVKVLAESNPREQ